jgi:serine/threonine protein phosphatase PrpC
MPGTLAVSIGQHSEKGRKEVNQDFHGAVIPEEPQLSLKGITVAIADGISSSDVSRIASESAVKSILTDYYCTSDTWSVKMSAQRVIAATNSWLHGQTQRSQYPHERDRGYVCTMSAVVIRSITAHIFHVGDARIYRIAGRTLEQLTEDHRVVISSEQSYLGRALGVNQQVEIDYLAVPVEKGDVFVLTTDGVYEYVNPHFIADSVEHCTADLDGAAKAIVAEAYRHGSPDNLTVQIVRIDHLPDGEASDVITRAADLPCPPLLDARDAVDRPRRRCGPSAAISDGGMGRAAHQQRPRVADARAVAKAKLPVRRHRVRRRTDAEAVDDRQPEAQP